MKKIDSRLLVGKIAADKDSRKLDKIIRIELMPGKTVKKNIPYTMILVSQPLKNDVIVPIEAEKVIKYDIQYAWFDITKKVFEEEMDRIKKEKLDHELYRGETKVKPSGGRRVAFDPLNLGHAQKERKR